MKKRYVTVLVVAALLIGATAGAVATSFSWLRSAEDFHSHVAVANVANSYFPLKLMSEGETNRAIALLQSNLQSGIQSVRMYAESFSRPELLTNSAVRAAIEMSEQPDGAITQEAAQSATP